MKCFKCGKETGDPIRPVQKVRVKVQTCNSWRYGGFRLGYVTRYRTEYRCENCGFYFWTDKKRGEL